MAVRSAAMKEELAKAQAIVEETRKLLDSAKSAAAAAMTGAVAGQAAVYESTEVLGFLPF